MLLLRNSLLSLLAASVAVFFAVVLTNPVNAQSEESRESITLSPATKRYTLEAGQVVKDEFTVINDGDTAYVFKVYVRPYSEKDSTYLNRDFNSTPPRADAYRWVSFAKTEWRLDPGASIKVPYTVAVPETATPGGHYGVLFAETQPDDPTSTSVARKKRVGSLIYANVKGDYKMEGSLASSSIQWFQPSSPLSARMSLKNTGNSDFEATSTMRISDIFGQVKHSGVSTHVVLPQTTRDVNLVWNDSPGLGLYKVNVRSEYLNKNESFSGYVLVAPLWALIVLFAAIAVALFLGYQKQHHRR